MRDAYATPYLQKIIDQHQGRSVTLYGVTDEEMTREELIGALRFAVSQMDRQREQHAKDMTLMGDLSRAGARW